MLHKPAPLDKRLLPVLLLVIGTFLAGDLLALSWDYVLAPLSTEVLVRMSEQPPSIPTTLAPRSGRIAFTSTRARPWQIYVLPAQGTEPLRLAPGGSPAFSPDGQ